MIGSTQIETEYSRRAASEYQRHRIKWGRCTRCELHKQRNKVVLGRGQLPAKILFIGEAPGVSEDLLGRPFIGPAGKLLDRMICSAKIQQSIAVTNFVCCIPRGEDGKKTGEPSQDCVKACSSRLKSFAAICKPELVILVGRSAAKSIPGASWFRTDDAPKNPPWIEEPNYLRFLELLHPAAILRMEVSQQALAYKRCVVALRDASEEIS